MEFYVDIDNTLYNTTKLKNDMLKKIAEITSQNNKNYSYESVLFHLISVFCREKIYNIYDLCNWTAKNYDTNEKKLVLEIKKILKNGKKYLYDDVIEFLKNLQKENTLHLLTQTSQENLEYQKDKIYGSGIKDFFNDITFTTTNKYSLNLDYKNSIFIDDNPKELIGLAGTETKIIYRIKRKDCKYSKIEVSSPKIIEYENLHFIEDFKQKNI